MRYVFNVFFVEKADRFKREKCIKFVHFARADVPPVSDVRLYSFVFCPALVLGLLRLNLFWGA